MSIRYEDRMSDSDALNVTLFSYDGQVHFAINSDPAAVTEGAFLTECLRKGVDEVLAVS